MIAGVLKKSINQFNMKKCGFAYKRLEDFLMGRCKITVLRTLYIKDLAESYPPYEKGPCTMLKEGDVFYTTGPHGIDMPEGFCQPGSRLLPLPMFSRRADGFTIVMRYI